MQSALTDEQFQLYESAGHCASMLVAAGVEKKLRQHVVTIGDLIVRYPDATTDEIQHIAESLQSTRDEGHAHQTYRQLKRWRKSHAKFKLHTPGYGLHS